MSQYKLVPVEPNKAALIGEFKFKITETCPQCFYEEPREDCEICEGANSYQREITVPWDTTKEMYRAMLEAAPVVNNPNQLLPANFQSQCHWVVAMWLELERH